jgi:hypothetical protein
MQASTPTFEATVKGASQTVAHAVSLTLPLTRTNLCPNPSFEVSTASWAATLATIATSSDRAAPGAGTKSLKITWGAAAARAASVAVTVPTQLGAVYTISAQAWAVSGTPGVQFWNPTAGRTGFAYFGAATTVADQWTQASFTFTATASTSTVYLVNAQSVPVSGTNVTYLDAVLIEQTSAVGSYFDGNTTNAAWQGTSGLSPSVLNTAFAAPQTRTNLCTNPSFETGTTGWAADFASVAPTLSQAAFPAPGGGGASLKVTFHGDSFPGAGVKTTFTSVVGVTYTCSMQLYVPTGTPVINIQPSGGIFHGFSTLFDQWGRVSVTFTATSTTTTIHVDADTVDPANSFFYVDQVLIEQTAALGTYFDGDTTNANWTGTPGVSTSILALTAYSDVGLAVESITIDRQLTTDMPDGTRLITGYPSAQATIVLSGLIDQTDASKTIAWLLNPAESGSPMYRKDALGSRVEVQAGLYLPGSTTPETYTTFTGTVDDYSVDMQDGTVTLTCLDDRSLFTATPSLPQGAFSSDTVAIGYGPGSVGPLLTSGWVLNQLCEQIGLYTSPPPRTSALFRQTNHGGAWPELGWQAAKTVGSTRAGWTAGRFAAQVPLDFFTQYYNSPPVGSANGNLPGDMGTSGDSWFVEGWIQPATDAAIVSPNDAFNFTLTGDGSVSGNISQITLGAHATSLGSALQPYVFVVRAGGPVFTTVTPATLTIPNDGQWHYFAIAMHFTSTTGISATFYVDGTTQTATGTMASAGNASNAPTIAGVFAHVPTESIQVTNETGTPAANNGFAASELVSIDASLNDLTAVPDTTGQDAWAVIQQIAAAEGAVSGLDETGKFQFINRQTLRSQPDQRTIAPTYSLKTLDQQVGRSFVRNHIIIPVNALKVQPASTVWAASEAIMIPAASTYTQIITTDNPVVNVSTFGQVMPNGGGTPGLTYWRACTTADGTGTARTGLTVTVTQTGPSTLLLTVVSTYTYPVWLVSPSGAGYPAGTNGLPRMWIGGQFVTAISGTTDPELATATSQATTADSQWPPASEGGAVKNVRGELQLAIAPNAYIQRVTAAQPYADDLLADLYKPRPLWRNVEIVLDPTLQLADRVLVADPETTMIEDSAIIAGSHVEISRSAWSQTLDLRAIGAPGSWLMGVVGRSEMGVSTYV